MQKELDNYKTEMQRQLEDILSYWMQYTVDEQHGGFAGKLDNDNNIDRMAAKGAHTC